jgi:hypothetical protein
LCLPTIIRLTRGLFSSISPARFRWTARPAGQGFMSTRRRENRWRRKSCTGRARASGEAIPSPIARRGSADASGGTAPPGIPVYYPSDRNLSMRAPAYRPSGNNLSPRPPAWLATNSPQSGYRIVQFVRQELRHGSPPFGAGPGTATGTPATHGSDLPHIPSPSGHARLHLTSPRDLAGRRRQAERYDGKRNLYFQHAARDAAGNS